VLFPADGTFTPTEFLDNSRRLPGDGQTAPIHRLDLCWGAVPLSHMTLALDEAVYGGSAISLTTMIFALDALILAIACINVVVIGNNLNELGISFEDATAGAAAEPEYRGRQFRDLTALAGWRHAPDTRTRCRCARGSPGHDSQTRSAITSSDVIGCSKVHTGPTRG